MIGQTISHYKIVESLGAGGMGVVYKAQDTRLNRFVALKFLPPELSRDEESNKRFIQEAQTASALDHPNICTIHDIGETDNGQLFIAMAYYDGQTLKKRIAQGSLPIDISVNIAIQMCEGLIKAHEANIVHRDIKPANVIIANDGLVKILDFGLAKLEGQSDLTKTGTTLGTVSYMSPEQARGEEADARSDIWSVGVTLYEMVAGQVPFQGELAAVIHAIQAVEPPPLTELQGGVPTELVRIVERTQSKRPEDRYQTVTDLRSELQQVQQKIGLVDDTPTMTMKPGLHSKHPSSNPPVKSKYRDIVATLCAVSVIIAIVFLGYLYFTGNRDNIRLVNAQQITSVTGMENYPVWSPDGNRIAYYSNQQTNTDIWITQLGDKQSINLTTESHANDSFPVWSPDGNQIAFLSYRSGDIAYYLMSSLGGRPRRITSSLNSRAQWSLDGQTIACMDRDTSGVFIKVLSLNSMREIKRIKAPGMDANRYDLSWSPDGRFFSYIDTGDYTGEVTNLWLLRVEDGQAVMVNDGRTKVWSPSWSPDSRTLYFVSNRGGAMDLWQQRLQENGQLDGLAQPVTNGIGMQAVSFSPDGKKLAYSKGRRVVNIWRVPILKDRTATWKDAQQITFDDAFIEFMDITPDGKQLLFSSDRRGNQDIWVMPVDSADPLQLTTEPAHDWAPRWSSDGKQIIFYSYRSGNRDLWIMPAEGGVAKQITNHDATDRAGAMSPDGNSIAFTSSRSGSNDVWVGSTQNNSLRQITQHLANDVSPEWSPDGKWLIFASDRIPVGHLWRVPLEGGIPEQLTKGDAWSPRWSPDGQTIYFTGVGDRINNLWSISTQAGTERQLTDFKARPGWLNPETIATDGTYLYFGWGEDTGDIWAMDVIWE